MRSSTQRRSMMPSRRSRSAGVDARALEPVVRHRQQAPQHELGGRRPRRRRASRRAHRFPRARTRGSSPRRPRTTSATTAADPRPPAPARCRSRTRRWRRCRRRSGRPAARGSPRAGAGGRARRRRRAGSSGRSCRCAGAARPSCGVSPRSSVSTGSCVVAHRQQRREEAHVLLEEVEDRGDPALAEPHARAHALGLQLLRARVGGLLEQRDPRLPPQLAAEEERRVGADRELHAGDALGGVPVAGERGRVDELVQLHARARGLGRDRVGVGGEPLDAVDRQVQVLPAGREDLLVEQRVARVGAERAGVQVVLGQRRQDPDHQQPRVRPLSGLLGVVEVGPDGLLEAGEHAALERARRDVDLDVELGELGLPVLVGDHLQHVLVRHRRVARLLGDVELDLEADRAPVGVEARLGEHAGEHVEAALHLLAVALAVLTREGGGLDLFPHARQSDRAGRAWQPQARPATELSDQLMIRQTSVWLRLSWALAAGLPASLNRPLLSDLPLTLTL